jgi:shikimate dehydrogenase
MKQFTIFGNPVKHSKSPQMHNAGFEHIGLDANYSKTLLEDGNDIKKVFLDNNISGANITVPHKEYAFKNADILDEFAQKIGAVNTYINENGKIKAYNTDAPGFYKAIEEYKNVNKVLLLGAGGTAKAIAVILKAKGFDVTVLNRSSTKKDFFTKLGCNFDDWNTFLNDTNYDLIINSTSAGLSDESYPCPKELLETIFQNAKYAIDCIYGKQTPFLQMATKYNLPNKDGEDMLLYQGVLAFELFTATKADIKVIEVMREALRNS